MIGLAAERLMLSRGRTTGERNAAKYFFCG
jgi:hypothetical protein